VSTFTVPFEFFDGELLVTINDVVTTAYTSTQSSVHSAGSITFTAVPAAGSAVKIVGATKAIQTVDYINNEGFPAETHELALDRLALAVQDATEASKTGFQIGGVSRGPTAASIDGKLLVGSTATGLTPIPTPRSGLVKVAIGGVPEILDIAVSQSFNVSREFVTDPDQTTTAVALPGMVAPTSGAPTPYVDAADAALDGRLDAIEASYATQAWVNALIAGLPSGGGSGSGNLNWWYNQGYTWSSEFWSTHVDPSPDFDVNETYELGPIQHLVGTGINPNAPPGNAGDNWHIIVLGHTPDYTLTQFAFPHVTNTTQSLQTRGKRGDLTWTPWVTLGGSSTPSTNTYNRETL
jgi:hypothetical protein